MTTLRVRKGATVGRPEARRSCFTEDLAAMPPTREASAALGVAMAAFIAKAFDGNSVNDEVRDAKSREESDAASDEGCCAEKCAAHVRACHLSIVGGSKRGVYLREDENAQLRDSLEFPETKGDVADRGNGIFHRTDFDWRMLAGFSNRERRIIRPLTNRGKGLKNRGLHFWIPRSRVNPRTKRIFRADFRLQFDAASQSAFSPSRFGTV